MEMKDFLINLSEKKRNRNKKQGLWYTLHHHRFASVSSPCDRVFLGIRQVSLNCVLYFKKLYRNWMILLFSIRKKIWRSSSYSVFFLSWPLSTSHITINMQPIMHMVCFRGLGDLLVRDIRVEDIQVGDLLVLLALVLALVRLAPVLLPNSIIVITINISVSVLILYGMHFRKELRMIKFTKNLGSLMGKSMNSKLNRKMPMLLWICISRPIKSVLMYCKENWKLMRQFWTK